MADSVEQTFQHEDFESGVEREFKFLIKKLLKISFFHISAIINGDEKFLKAALAEIEKLHDDYGQIKQHMKNENKQLSDILSCALINNFFKTIDAAFRGYSNFLNKYIEQEEISDISQLNIICE